MKNKLKVQRAMHDLTQQQLAEALGIARQTVYAIESQQYNPSVLLSLRIARFFKVPVEDIFGLEEGEDNFHGHYHEK